jgi:hypothetical protein
MNDAIVKEESAFRPAALDTEYEEIKPREPELAATVPATLETFSLVRHDLMKGKSNSVIESVIKEIEVDQELGLDQQLALTGSRALVNDIDELTSSRNYFQVSQELLKKLFQFNKLQWDCVWFNILSPVKGFFKAGVLPLFLHAAMLLLIYPMILYSMKIWPLVSKLTTPFLVTLSVFNIILWLGLGALLVLGFVFWDGRAISYVRIGIKIKSTPLSMVSEKIPYGAKLKVLEAKKTGIFKDFVYITPEFNYEERYKIIKYPELPSIDPAILGTTEDGRMYMIVYWDIEKDVAKVVKEIEHFKKFKLRIRKS